MCVYIQRDTHRHIGARIHADMHVYMHVCVCMYAHGQVLLGFCCCCCFLVRLFVHCAVLTWTLFL